MDGSQGPPGKEKPCDIEGHKWPQSWQDEKWYALTIPVSHATSLETEKGRECFRKMKEEWDSSFGIYVCWKPNFSRIMTVEGLHSCQGAQSKDF